MNARTEATWPEEADEATSSLRVPPHSVEAEQSVLGALMLENGAFDRACDLVQEVDFYRHEHRLIFAAIAGLIVGSKTADVVTVFERLQADGKAADIGGLAYLNDLAQSVPSANGARGYAQIVRDRSIRRRLIAISDDIAAAAFNPQGRSTSALLADAGTKLSALESGTIRRQPKQLRELTAGRVERVSALASGDVTIGWPTGHPALDGLLHGGLRPGKVYVLAARPSVGKSSFAQDLGIYLARQALPVLMLSQEMPEDEVADRALSSIGQVDYSALQTGKLTPDGWTNLTAAVDGASALPFWVDDQPALRLTDIRAKARSVKGLKVLILDYLQLSSGSSEGGKGENRNTEIEEISRGLKALAKDLGIAVLELSQLNRSVELRATKRPQLSDLRDSGAIEQDADVVMFLWPVRKYDAKRVIGCAVDKNRGGPLGEFALDFWGSVHCWKQSEETLHTGHAAPAGKGFE